LPFRLPITDTGRPPADAVCANIGWVRHTRWDALLIDIDGVLHVGATPIDGALEVVKAIRTRGTAFRLVTNTTSRSRRLVVQRLNGMGFDLDENDVLTPAALAVDLCRRRGYERVTLHVTDALHEDLAQLEGTGGTPEAVIVGDLGEQFTWHRLNQIFTELNQGAELIALQRNRVWESQDGLVLDAGPFVAALEYAADTQAVVTGKPSQAFFAQALEQLGRDAARAVMIGDDLEADVGGALDAGLDGVLVRTGKFRQEILDTGRIEPTLVWDSIAELADYL
jgi:HAD superfamily hydrolase (TIGR01458 family)